ncbi:vitamin K epoxide reductase family protein [Flavobacteriaceae bacterium M23B6Z8]
MDSNDIPFTLMKLFKKKRISVDKNAFSYYLKSHPEYPQILSIVNALDHFNIKYGVYQADSIQEVAASDNCFLGTFRGKNGNVRLALVEHKNNYFKVNATKLPENIIEKSWGNMALILEDNPELKKTYSKNVIAKSITVGLVLTLILISAGFSTSVLGFSLLAAIGVLLSMFALKDVFNFNNAFQEKICTISKQSDCKTVITSKKWKLFKLLDFADLSFAFFVSQLLLLIILSILDLSIPFFRVQFFALIMTPLFAIPSIYYQKFVVKVWCPVCLGIVLTLTLEFFFIFLIFKHELIISLLDFDFIFLNLSVFIAIYFIWRSFKKLLIRNHELISKVIIRNRTLNDYQMFKNILVSGKKINTDLKYINFNNNNTNLNVTLITDPFCEYCSSMFRKLDVLLANKQAFVNWNIVFNVDLNEEPDFDKAIYRTMMNLQMSNKTDIKAAMRDWYNTTNEKKWIKKYEEPNLDVQKIDHILTNQHEWCHKSGISYTPAVLINGHELPKLYTIDDLFFMIDELLEDQDY